MIPRSTPFFVKLEFVFINSIPIFSNLPCCWKFHIHPFYIWYLIVYCFVKIVVIIVNINKNMLHSVVSVWSVTYYQLPPHHIVLDTKSWTCVFMLLKERKHSHELHWLEPFAANRKSEIKLLKKIQKTAHYLLNWNKTNWYLILFGLFLVVFYHYHLYHLYRDLLLV